MPTLKSEEFQDRLDDLVGEYADSLNPAEVFGSLTMVAFLWLLGSVERASEPEDGPDAEDDDDDSSEAWKNGRGPGGT